MEREKERERRRGKEKEIEEETEGEKKKEKPYVIGWLINEIIPNLFLIYSSWILYLANRKKCTNI